MILLYCMNDVFSFCVVSSFTDVTWFSLFSLCFIDFLQAEKKLQRVDTENSCDNVTPNVMNGTQDDKLRHWRNAILADICSSVEDGSFRRCIRDAMLSHSDNQIDKIFKV